MGFAARQVGEVVVYDHLVVRFRCSRRTSDGLRTNPAPHRATKNASTQPWQGTTHGWFARRDAHPLRRRADRHGLMRRNACLPDTPRGMRLQAQTIRRAGAARAPVRVGSRSGSSMTQQLSKTFFESPSRINALLFKERALRPAAAHQGERFPGVDGQNLSPSPCRR